MLFSIRILSLESNLTKSSIKQKQMKKVIMATLCCISFASSYSQITVKPGVRAGLNISSLTNYNADSKADFYVGGQVGIQFTKFYTLQPELTYSRQGATVNDYYDFYTALPPEFDPNFSPRRSKYDIELQYLSLSVANKFKIIEGFHALVGPSLDFKIGDNLDYNDDLIGFDLGVFLGLGYTFSNGFGVEARFKQGLIDIFGNDYDYYHDNDYYYDDYIDNVKLNQVFQIGASYSF